jgi:hypothetical protein
MAWIWLKSQNPEKGKPEKVKGVYPAKVRGVRSIALKKSERRTKKTVKLAGKINSSQLLTTARWGPARVLSFR